MDIVQGEWIVKRRNCVATFVNRGSHTGQAIRNDGFFFVYQCVRVVASFGIGTRNYCEIALSLI
jgi:hypothetical protein